MGLDTSNIKIVDEKTLVLKKYFKNDKKIFLIIDKLVFDLYADKLEIDYDDIYKVKASEDNKTLEEATKLYLKLTELNYSKHDYIVYIGGGIVGDLAGYVAATYKRGINLIAIPTTLLAQVDSAIGAKVALNLNTFKNVVGTYKEPILTIVNIDFLNTLDKKILNDSYSEVIKYSIISIFKYDLLEQDIEFRPLIGECIKKKLEIVKIDPYDEHERHILNYGHSIAHLIEQKYKYTHGYAVAMGMYMTAVIFENKKVISRLEKLYKKYDIEIDRTIELDLNLLQTDKKAQNDKIKEVIVQEFANPQIITLTISEYIKRYNKTWMN